MPYRDCLKRWVVVRLVTATDRPPVARFIKFSDAEGHAHTLNRQHPTERYLVMFDPTVLPESDESVSEFPEIPQR